MWLELDLKRFSVTQDGFHPLVYGDRTLYCSPGLDGLTRIEGLASSEYGQAIEIDANAHTVTFGRDYLGHHPLLYAVLDTHLFISDEYRDVREWLRAHRQGLTLSEEAVALYFATGYVPQGMTLFDRIKTCENASLYRWQRGKVTRTDLFKPIEEEAAFTLPSLGERIDSEVARIGAQHQEITVWCSGGLDSSVVAQRFSGSAKKVNLLTLSYDSQAIAKHGEGEIRFARDVGDALELPLRYAPLTSDVYRFAVDQLVRAHIGPVIDYVVPPKYVLAKASHGVAVTGEGGDPLFGGVKNNTVLFAHDRLPSLGLGWLYALAHDRFMGSLQDVLQRGEELKTFVADYFEEQLARYPGSLVRKLLYANTFAKQGGMIFPKNYYAGKRHGVAVRHPLTSLAVYDGAFRLADEKKYEYPRGKLALVSLYGAKLPASVIKRKKSGTRLFMDYYLQCLAPNGLELDALWSTGLFKEEFLAKMQAGGHSQPILAYGLFILNNWLKHNGGTSHEAVSSKTRHHQQSAVGL